MRPRNRLCGPPQAQGQPRWKSWAESSSCPEQLATHSCSGTRPYVLLNICPYAPVPERLPDGLSGLRQLWGSPERAGTPRHYRSRMTRAA